MFEGIAEIDDSRFPLVIVRMLSTATPEQIDAYFEVLDGYARRGRFVIIADPERLDPLRLDATTRKYFVESGNRWSAKHGHALIAELIVIRSRPSRALYAFYTWLRQNRSFPTELFESIDAAKVRAEVLLDSQSE